MSRTVLDGSSVTWTRAEFRAHLRAWSSVAATIAVGVSVLSGCRSDLKGADTGANTGTGDTSTTDACPVGQESCPCTVGGSCDLGLVCLSELCVDPGATGTSVGTSTGTSSHTGTGPGSASDAATGDPATNTSTDTDASTSTSTASTGPGCLMDADCKQPMPICAGGTCVECSEASHCPVGAVCDDMGSCVECQANRDCIGIGLPQCCSGTCVDSFSDRAHCGMCDVPCDTGRTCTGGTCV